MKKLPLILGLLLISIAVFAFSARADDIPANCETGAKPNIFARYEAHNDRLVLVDWNMGADVQVIETGLTDTQVLGWSPDCRYLVGAVGTYESMDTVVWDVTTGARVGAVPDAHAQPHYITWGPGNYLVVETRSGAILWNIPANTQVTLTTSFDHFTARNFNRLRWDAEHGQLIANLAAGGREVYDLATGQQVELAASAAVVYPTGNQSAVTLAGNSYLCIVSYDRYGNNFGGLSVSGAVDDPGSDGAIWPEYKPADGTLMLRRGRTEETVLVLETGMTAPWVEFRGWSRDCRYLVTSIGRTGEDASDTVVWDVLENRRVGIVPDARQMMHPIHIGRDALLITTREGGYLWYLPTNTLTMINPVVETPLAGQSGIESFVQVVWDDTNAQVLIIPTGRGNVVQAFVVRDGQLVAEYGMAEVSRVSFDLSPRGSMLNLRGGSGSAYRSVLIYRPTGAEISVPNGRIVFSQEDRFAALDTLDQYLIWDMTALRGDGIPNYTYPRDRRLSLGTFLDGTRVRLGGYTMDVLTGEISVLQPSAWGVTAAPAVNGQHGYGVLSLSLSWPPFMEGQCREREAIEILSTEVLAFRSTDTRIVLEFPDIAPDCRFVAGVIGVRQIRGQEGLDGSHNDRLKGFTYIWDTASGELVGEFPNFGSNYETQIWWSPDAQYALVRTGAGHFLWDANTSRGTILSADNPERTAAISDRDWRLTTYWDYGRGQMLVSLNYGVGVFDLRTGILRAALYGPNVDPFGGTFSVSSEGRYVFSEEMAIWDLETLSLIGTVRDGNNTILNTKRNAINPDGSRLAIGGTTIRVWDISQGQEFDAPIARFNGPDYRIRAIRFVDNVTVEATSWDGEVTYWNIETGEQVMR